MSAHQNDWTVLTMLEWGSGYFEQKEVPSPRLSIEWLLADVLDIKRLDLYLDYNRPLGSDERDKLRPLVKRRARHEPLQYITGCSDFLGSRLVVSPEVLIPRMETEQLTEIILDNHPSTSELSILDIGTGSGCIAVLLKKERQTWDIHAIDISQEALKVAEQNAERLQTDIHFVRSDIKQNPGGLFEAHSFDLIVSNPPYVLPSEKESLEKQVKDFEPSEALFCDDVEEAYQPIIDFSQEFLRKGGQLYLELNADYSEMISSLFDGQLWSCSVINDYDQNPRFIRANLDK